MGEGWEWGRGRRREEDGDRGDRKGEGGKEKEEIIYMVGGKRKGKGETWGREVVGEK